MIKGYHHFFLILSELFLQHLVVLVSLLLLFSLLMVGNYVRVGFHLNVFCNGKVSDFVKKHGKRFFFSNWKESFFRISVRKPRKYEYTLKRCSKSNTIDLLSIWSYPYKDVDFNNQIFSNQFFYAPTNSPNGSSCL